VPQVEVLLTVKAKTSIVGERLGLVLDGSKPAVRSSMLVDTMGRAPALLRPGTWTVLTEYGPSASFTVTPPGPLAFSIELSPPIAFIHVRLPDGGRAVGAKVWARFDQQGVPTDLPITLNHRADAVIPLFDGGSVLVSATTEGAQAEPIRLEKGDDRTVLLRPGALFKIDTKPATTHCLRAFAIGTPFLSDHLKTLFVPVGRHTISVVGMTEGVALAGAVDVEVLSATREVQPLLVHVGPAKPITGVVVDRAGHPLGSIGVRLGLIGARFETAARGSTSTAGLFRIAPPGCGIGPWNVTVDPPFELTHAQFVGLGDAPLRLEVVLKQATP